MYVLLGTRFDDVSASSYRSGCAGQLAALAADLRETRFEDLGHSAVYQV